MLDIKTELKIISQGNFSLITVGQVKYNLTDSMIRYELLTLTLLTLNLMRYSAHSIHLIAAGCTNKRFGAISSPQVWQIP